MQTKTSTIGCPDCNTPIIIEINQLILGAKFSCTNCNASISLASESKPIVEKTVETYSKSISQLSKS